MKEILRTAATGSPSAVNQQAYKFYVMYNKAILHAIADKALAALVRQGFDIPACLSLCVPTGKVFNGVLTCLICHVTVQQFTGTKKMDVIFYDPPVVVFVTLPRLSTAFYCNDNMEEMSHFEEKHRNEVQESDLRRV